MSKTFRQYSKRYIAQLVEQRAFNPKRQGSSPCVPKFIIMVTIGINFVLGLATTVFFIGLFGVVLNRKNILTVLMAIELLLLGVNLNFATLSIYLDDIVGHIFVIFILTIAAAESAIGLSIITTFYKLKNSIELDPVKKKLTNKI